MALYIDCDRCGSHIDEPSALVFGPPSKFGGAVSKYHICETCYYDLNEFLESGARHA